MRISIRSAALLTLAIALTPVPSAAQDPAGDREAVRQAVLDYVEGFYQGDTARLVRSIHPDVAKYGYYIPRDSAHYVGEAMPWPEFLSYANMVRTRNREAPASAPREITIFEVQDQTASARLRAGGAPTTCCWGKKTAAG